MEAKRSDPPPSYNQAVGLHLHGQQSSARYTVGLQPLHGQSSPSPALLVPPPAAIQGPMVREPDMAYLKSPGGILKIIEAVSCLVAFIINMTTYYIGSGFTSFATINGFIQAVIWFVLKLMHMVPQIIANYYIELVICCILLAFLLVGFILSAVSLWTSMPVTAVCFFCFITVVSYGLDILFQVIDIRRKFSAHQQELPAAVTQ